MNDDERFASWSEQIIRIERETTGAFWNRKMFRAVREMLKTNEGLSKAEGAKTAYHWIATTQGVYFAMCVRRELDTQKGAVTLHNLLRDIESHSHILTRSRWKSRFTENGLPEELAQEQFGRFGTIAHADDGEPYLSADQVRADVRELEQKTKAVEDYGHRVAAHRTPDAGLVLTIDAVDDALGAIFECMNKYHVLLTGARIAGATPTPQFDHLSAFRMPWIHKDYKEPEDPKFAF